MKLMKWVVIEIFKNYIQHFEDLEEKLRIPNAGFRMRALKKLVFITQTT